MSGINEDWRKGKMVISDLIQRKKDGRNGYGRILGGSIEGNVKESKK